MKSTQQLIAAARRVGQARLPADVLTVAKHCVLDWLGVTLAGAREPVARILYEQVGRSDRGDEATLLGLDARSSLPTAALVHGTAAHALDYDDTHWGLQGHPTAPVLAAIWGLAERERVSGDALLTALVTGIEVECRLGRWLNPQHYALGFHATGTLGAFGAAAAAAQLLDLDDTAWLWALGLAGTQAAGLKSAFGSMAKPLHVGRAAQNGLTAALLAKGGFTACAAILDDEQGFAATHGQVSSPLEAASPGAGFEISETLFKYHAACHLTHATIEALHGIMRAHPIAVEDIAHVALTVDSTCLGVCAIERPESGLQAKFSLKATAALALFGHATEDPRTFSDGNAQAPQLRALMQKVHVGIKPMAATRTELSVHLSNGQAHQAAHDSGIPERNLDLQGQKIARKFDHLAPLSAAVRQELRAMVGDLERLADVREITRLICSHEI
jgi:2-methylcitrate dehydratase PrpD